ncbi:MAG: thymidylate kinase, partial [Candidatus Micrarchaeia archaeon]
MRGKIIVIEGTDSTGKKTQARELAARLKAAGIPAENAAFPSYESPFGALTADYLQGKFGSLSRVPVESAALLYSADRYQYKKEFEDKLAQGVWLVIDRYTSSSFGHQAGKLADAGERERCVDWLKAVESRLPPADCIVFLDLPVAVSLELKAKRAGKHAGTDLHEEDARHLEDSRR